MNKPELFSEDNQATYCPEDNKLRLYVGRVPRPEYDALRAEGWVSTPKQSEAGQGEFAATWTPERRDTALSYAGVIGDEDASPQERAADRAERFGGYRDKRTTEATGYADRYDSAPAAHGYQNQQRAERAAARHDRIADRSCDAWSKAEYWQQRTAGVISHALYKSRPDVRMGRIKELEAEVRKIEASYAKAHAEQMVTHAVLLAIVEHAEGKREKLIPYPGWQYSVSYIREADKLPKDAPLTPEQLRRCMISAAFYGHYSGRWQELRKQAQAGEIEAAAVAREWLDANGWEPPAPFDPTKSDWHQHLTLRLAYENQMLEAQGGRAAFVEMIPGGWLGDRQIQKVNKSPATGRVVSVLVRDNHASACNHWGNPWPDNKPRILSHTIETERLSADTYRPPTPDELAAFNEAQKQAKAKAKAARAEVAIPLINPTDEDADRLQALWNEKAKAEFQESIFRQYGNGQTWINYIEKNWKPSTVWRTDQETYSAASKGAYAHAKTREMGAGCELQSTHYNAKKIAAFCKLRTTWGDGGGTSHPARRVIVLTDKPQKPLPAAVWEAKPEAVTA